MYQVIKVRLSEAPNPIRLVKNKIVKCIETSDEMMRGLAGFMV